MSEGIRLLVAGLAGLVLIQFFAPVMRYVALRTSFLDHPAGYKVHGGATPYLGGTALVAAFIAATAIATDLGAWATLITCLLLLTAVGTLDDRIGLPIGIRLAFQVGCGFALWTADSGWVLGQIEVLNLAITVFWVVGIVNAFNLMDNQDGAAASVGASSCIGIALISQLHGGLANAVLATALAGACIGFLRFNLAKPSRIFLGDGGSMPLGLAVAALVMAAPWGSAGISDLFVAIPLVGLPILDTTLVVFSRQRRGVAVLSGARDHLTHRLLAELKTPRRVAATLALAQVALVALTVLMYEVGSAEVGILAILYLAGGALTIVALDDPRWLPGLAAERAQVVEEISV